jgi:hypothetical protein
MPTPKASAIFSKCLFFYAEFRKAKYEKLRWPKSEGGTPDQGSKSNLVEHSIRLSQLLLK